MPLPGQPRAGCATQRAWSPLALSSRVGPPSVAQHGGSGGKAWADITDNDITDNDDGLCNPKGLDLTGTEYQGWPPSVAQHGADAKVVDKTGYEAKVKAAAAAEMARMKAEAAQPGADLDQLEAKWKAEALPRWPKW